MTLEHPLKRQHLFTFLFLPAIQDFSSAKRTRPTRETWTDLYVYVRCLVCQVQANCTTYTLQSQALLFQRDQAIRA
jgi:hypothetical protein